MLSAVRDFSRCVYAALCVGDAIDFCVWVLEQDGLRVPPFDKHPDGDGSLQARGMTAENWLDWTRKTALLLDQRLEWELDPIARREWSIEQYEQLKARAMAQDPDAFFPQLERAQLVEQLDRQYNWRVAQRQKMQAIMRQVYGDVPPPDAWEDEITVWDGERAIADRLYELREHYPVREREQAWLDLNLDEAGRITGPLELIVKLEAAFDSIQSELAEYDGAEIHLVTYPYPVEMALLPGALVLSQSSELRNQQMFDDRINHAINQLIGLHNN